MDTYVCCVVWLHRKLSDRGKELMEEFREEEKQADNSSHKSEGFLKDTIRRIKQALGGSDD